MHDARMPSTAFTRRSLLRGGGVAAGAWLVAHPALSFATALTDPAAPAYLRRSSYAGLVGSGFTPAGTDGATLTLTSVGDLGDPALAGADDAFSLIFTGPVDALGQDTYTLAHPSLGSFSMFVVPVGEPTASASYQAIINRSVGLPAAAPTASPPAADAPAPAEVAAPLAATPGAAAEQPWLEHVSIRRTAHGLLCDIELSDPAVVSVHATLLHGGRTVADAVGVPLHGAAHVLLRPHRHVAAGHYQLRVRGLYATGHSALATHALRLK